MHLTALLIFSLPILGAYAAPKALPPGTTTCTDEPRATNTSAVPITAPTAPYTVIAARSGSPIHFLSMTAAGQKLYLGGQTASYCPTVVNRCPPGNATAFVGTGAMDVEVPGGQRGYIAPDGHLGYTQAHSTSYPAGSVVLPFIYTKKQGAAYGQLSTNAFNASGFMACPTSTYGYWQVFAATQHAVVPKWNVSACLGFDALAVTYSINGTFAAWQYM